MSGKSCRVRVQVLARKLLCLPTFRKATTYLNNIVKLITLQVLPKSECDSNFRMNTYRDTLLIYLIIRSVRGEGTLLRKD